MGPIVDGLLGSGCLLLLKLPLSSLLFLLLFLFSSCSLLLALKLFLDLLIVFLHDLQLVQLLRDHRGLGNEDGARAMALASHAQLGLRERRWRLLYGRFYCVEPCLGVVDIPIVLLVSRDSRSLHALFFLQARDLLLNHFTLFLLLPIPLHFTVCVVAFLGLHLLLSRYAEYLFL